MLFFEESIRDEYEVDVLVVGGGFGGVAAACAAASERLDVCLIESRTYLGHEMMATLRPWLTSEQRSEIQERYQWEDDWALKASDGTGEWVIVPLRLKTSLEESLLNLGIRLFYGATPVSWKYAGRSFVVEIIGKFGRRTVRARTVVDASPCASLLACTRDSWQWREESKSLRGWRSLELTGVDPGFTPAEPLEVPSSLTSDVRVHQGWADKGHILIEHECGPVSDIYPASGWPDTASGTLQSMEIARWLHDHHPAFGESKVAATSYEPYLPPLRRALGGDFDSVNRVIHTIAGDLDLSAFWSQKGIWVANGCADVTDHIAFTIAEDPASLTDIGWEVGLEAGRRIRRISAGTLPTPVPVGETHTLPTERRHVDVLVVGGGSSGIAAAIGAGRQGVETLLLEMNPLLGGTGTLGGIDSYWYGRRCGFNLEVSQAVKAESEWIKADGRKWSIPGKMNAWLRLAQDAGVDVLTRAVLVDVLVLADGRVTGVRAVGDDRLIEVYAAVVVDATGDGDVAFRAGAKSAYGSDRECAIMWYSMAPHPKPGVTRNNFTSTVDVGDLEDYTRAILSARRRGGNHDHAIYVAPRESRHILGEVRLTLTDQLLMKQWPDVVSIAFSNHDIKGQSTSDWLRMGLIPPNLEVEIPYRCLIPQGVEGVVVSGKAVSAYHDALPAIRMQADLENLGYACGLAASMCVQERILPRELPVRSLQEELIRTGQLPSEVLDRLIEEFAGPNQAAMRAWVEELDDRQMLYDYSDMGFDEVFRDPIPIVQVCTAGPTIVPLLVEALNDPKNTTRRLSIARALAWYGDTRSTPVLLEVIESHLNGPNLPARVAKVRHAGYSPDQGAMPDLAYLLHTLAMVRDRHAIPVIGRVVEMIEPKMEVFIDRKSGLFHYVDSICDIAERLGDPACLPILKRLYGYPLFRGHVMHGVVQQNFFLERLAYLEIVIARTMLRCGGKEGAQILATYLSDARRLLVRHAYRELRDVCGKEFAPDCRVWESWLEGVDRLDPKPWINEPDYDRPFLVAAASHQEVG